MLFPLHRRRIFSSLSAHLLSFSLAIPVLQKASADPFPEVFLKMTCAHILKLISTLDGACPFLHGTELSPL